MLPRPAGLPSASRMAALERWVAVGSPPSLIEKTVSRAPLASWTQKICPVPVGARWVGRSGGRGVTRVTSTPGAGAGLAGGGGGLRSQPRIARRIRQTEVRASCF